MARLLIVSRSMALAMRLADQHEVTEHPVDELDALGTDLDADVLVLDVGDPMQAVTAVNHLREAGQVTPVLLVSGYQPEWEQVEAQQVEGVVVVPLPITRAALLAGIAQLTGTPEPVLDAADAEEVVDGDGLEVTSPFPPAPITDDATDDAELAAGAARIASPGNGRKTPGVQVADRQAPDGHTPDGDETPSPDGDGLDDDGTEGNGSEGNGPGTTGPGSPGPGSPGPGSPGAPGPATPSRGQPVTARPAAPAWGTTIDPSTVQGSASDPATVQGAAPEPDDEQAGYDTAASYDNGGYGNSGYGNSGYGNGGYDTAAGYDTAGYDPAGYENTTDTGSQPVLGPPSRRLPRLGNRPRKLQRRPNIADTAGLGLVTDPLGPRTDPYGFHARHASSAPGSGSIPAAPLAPPGPLTEPDQNGAASSLDRRLDADAAALAQQRGRSANGVVMRPADLVQSLLDQVGDLYGVSDTAQVLADDVIERADADAAAILVPDGPIWRVSGGVGLRPLERRLILESTHWLITEIGAAGRAVLIDDTDIIRPQLSGAPLAAWRHLLAVPVPEVRAIAVLARGQEAGPFTDRDLAAVIAPVREAAALLAQAVQTRKLARALSALREAESDGRTSGAT